MSVGSDVNEGLGPLMATLFGITGVADATPVINQARLQEVLSPGESCYCMIRPFSFS